MPLVRIDLIKGRSEEQLATLADTVYQVERDMFAAPEDDRYIIIHEHEPGRMVIGGTGLGYQRTSEAMVIQFTDHPLPRRPRPRRPHHPATRRRRNTGRPFGRLNGPR
jgi:phenylpyruvate tautomerase PptA (4-oxalocrotonate tautomerase family)